MKRAQLYLSTIAPDAAAVAGRFGLGLEIAEYCTAWNMDRDFALVHPQVLAKAEGVPNRVLHAPFNELFPCAIDPRARELAAERYRQAAALARHYGAQKLVIHGGYHPYIYYPSWYVEQSAAFWREFLQSYGDGPEIVLENVLEEEPGLLPDIVARVADPRLRLCLDVGHVNAYSPAPVLDWLRIWAPYLRHFHLHNNDGSRDAHCALGQGSIPMDELLRQAGQLCPEATCTLEVMEAEPSVSWLLERHLLEQ